MMSVQVQPAGETDGGSPATLTRGSACRSRQPSCTPAPPYESHDAGAVRCSRAGICSQAIVEAQIRTGAVTQDGMTVMFTRQLLEHEDCAYERVILLCGYMARDEEIESHTAKSILEALAKELKSLQQPPPGQPGVIL